MRPHYEIDAKSMQEFPWPKPDANKHSRGRLAVFSGLQLHTGAARLAAMAGARIGSGWVKVLAPIEAAKIIACHQTSIMVGEYAIGTKLSQEILAFDCAIIGMGFGDGAEQTSTIERLLQSSLPLVLDADAINIIAKTDEFYKIMQARNSPCVLTPHANEFARIFGAVPNTDMDNRCAQVLELARKTNAIIVLKGAQTIIATPCGELAINNISTPWLASAGTGDVLAGFIGGLMAQGTTAFSAAKIAVFLHSQLGLQIGAGLLAEDIPPRIGEILNQFAPDYLKSKRYKFNSI